MTTQYTPTLKLALPVTGELSGTWGDTVNDNITSMIEQAIAGLSTINTWTANAHTLTTANGTTSESRCAMLVAATGGGAPTAAADIICPAAAKLYVLQNNTSFAVTLKTSAGTGVAVAAGDTAFLFCDATNVNSCVTTIVNGNITGNLTVGGNATINGNTTLGNATSDTITATARFNTDLVPSTDNARDLGSAANSWKDLFIDGTATMALVAISGGTINGVSIGATTAATLINVDNLRLDGNTLSSTDTNGNVVIAPNGTGDVQLDADTVRVGDAAAAATLTSNGAGALTVTTGGAADLTLSTNSGTTSGTVVIANGANGNITLTPDGTGDVILSADRVQMGDSNTDTTLTTNGTGSLNLTTNNGTNSGTIQLAQGVNGNITLTPNGTGFVTVSKLSVTDTSTLVKTLTLGDTSFNGTAVFAAATPAKLYMGTGTVTDVTSAISATNAIGAIASLGITPIAATNTSVTYTSAATLYIAGAPSAGTNVTLTNPYSLWINTGTAFLNGPVILGSTLAVNGAIDFNNTTDSTSTTTGAVIVDGGVGIAKSLFVGGNITVTKNTATSFLRLQSLAPYGFPGDFTIQAGGQSTPGMSIVDNTAAQERLTIVTGLTVFNEAGADQDFRVEGDTAANLFFVDAGNDRIGINTNVPTSLFHLSNAANTPSFRDLNTRVWNMEFAVTENTNYQRFKITADTTRRSCLVRIVYAPQSSGGISSMNGGTAEFSIWRADGGVGFSTISIFNAGGAGAGSISLAIPTVSGNDVLFGFQVGNNGTGSDYTTEVRIEIISYTPNDFTVATISGTTANTGSALNGAFALFSGVENIRADSSSIVFNEQSNDIDFRVESDGNANMLFVDGGNNRVAIGAQQWGVSTTPLQVNNIAITDSGAAHHILIGNQDSGGTNTPSMIRGVNGTLHLGWGDSWTSATGGTMTQAFSVVGSSPSVVVNDDGADIDFRVESDTNTHALFVDAGNDQVVIGGSAPVTGSTNNIPLIVRYSSGPAARFYSNVSASMAATLGISLVTYGSSKYSGYQTTTNGGGMWVNSSSGASTYITGGGTSGVVYLGNFNQDPFENASVTFVEYANFNSNEVVINETSRDQDFRVESDNSSHGLFLDAAQASVSVNTSSTAAFFNVQGSATRIVSQELGNGDSQGTAQFNRIVKLCPSVSSNNKLIIPFTNQGSLNSTTVCRVIGHNAAYNTSTPYGFEITFAVGHLSAMYSLSYWNVGGNAVSAAINGQTVEITFTNAYNVAYSTSGGVFVTLEYMTNTLGYSIDVNGIVLN